MNGLTALLAAPSHCATGNTYFLSVVLSPADDAENSRCSPTTYNGNHDKPNVTNTITSMRTIFAFVRVMFLSAIEPRPKPRTLR